jgi:hypothetical protein
MQFRRLLIIVLVAESLAACGSGESPPPVFSDIGFAGAPVRLDVSQIDVVSEFEPTFHEPEVEQNFPEPPQRALADWAHQKLAADNPSSPLHARVTILDAAAHDLGGGSAYDLKLAVRVAIVDQLGNQLKSLTLDASRTISVDPDASADERDHAWYDMTREAVDVLTGELERRIATSFYPYAK